MVKVCYNVSMKVMRVSETPHTIQKSHKEDNSMGYSVMVMKDGEEQSSATQTEWKSWGFPMTKAASIGQQGFYEIVEEEEPRVIDTGATYNHGHLFYQVLGMTLGELDGRRLGDTAELLQSGADRLGTIQSIDPTKPFLATLESCWL